MQQQQTISQSDYNVCWKVEFLWQPAITSSVVGPRSSSKALPKVKLAPEKVMVTVWWSAAHLSHYSLLNPGKTITPEKYAQQIDEMHWRCSVCSQHWWTERAQFFQATVPEHTSHNLCFRSWANLDTCASPAIFTWPLANHLPLLQAPQ